MKKLLLILLLMSGTVWADSTRFTLQADIDDAHIRKSASSPFWADSNHGANTTTIQSSVRAILFRLNGGWRTTIGAGRDVDSIVCSLLVSSTTGNDTIPVYGVWKSDCWVEGTGTTTVPTTTGVTWNDWDGPNSEWGTLGCANASDAGSYNCTDAAGYDRTATAMDSVHTLGTTGWKTFTISGTFAQNMYDADKAVSVLLDVNGSFQTDFHSMEASSASNRPRLWVYHVAASSPASGSNVILRGTTVRGTVIR